MSDNYKFKKWFFDTVDQIISLPGCVDFIFNKLNSNDTGFDIFKWEKIIVNDNIEFKLTNNLNSFSIHAPEFNYDYVDLNSSQFCINMVSVPTHKLFRFIFSIGGRSTTTTTSTTTSGSNTTDRIVTYSITFAVSNMLKDTRYYIM
jgi:hypothetical protein